MNRKRLSAFVAALFCSANFALAQVQLNIPSEGGSKKAAVTEFIGLTEVSIRYDRPAVRGREGKIWGGLVPFGLSDQGYGTSKAAPWRAGANENTVISFSSDVKIEGKSLAAGKYGLFMVVSESEVTVIFSKNHQAWGTYFYEPANDALKVTVKPAKVEASKEYLEYEFMNQTANSATIVLAWEKWQIPFKIEADVVNTTLASIREELKGDKAFAWQSWNQAANYCLRHNTNLEEGLVWAENAISLRNTGEKNFTTLATKAMFLSRLNKQSEADALMKEALPLGKMMEVHGYGRQLITQKKFNEALEVFKMNAKKNPSWTTSWGLARGYSAVGDFKNAVKYAELALSQNPDEQNKNNIQNSIPKLKDKKDINQ